MEGEEEREEGKEEEREEGYHPSNEYRQMPE